jgi:PAS domain-containing protein
LPACLPQPIAAPRSFARLPSIEQNVVAGVLTEERDLLTKVVDGVPDLIYEKDRKSRFLFANYAVAKMLGVPNPKALLGKTDFDVHSRELAEKYFTDEQRIMDSGEPMVSTQEM